VLNRMQWPDRPQYWSVRACTVVNVIGSDDLHAFVHQIVSSLNLG
jgi:hypothetical protein